MEELNLLEQSTNNPLSENFALSMAVIPESDEMNLLDVMEFCAGLCLAHPLCLLQILQEHCAESSSEICFVPLMAEIMSLRLSPFGRRLSQIH